MARYNKNQGFIGMGTQVSKGTAVGADIYLPVTEETTLTPVMEFDMQREGGDGVYTGHTVKTIQKVDGSFAINVKADMITLIAGLLLGDDTVTGASAPYTHTIVPQSDPTSMGWFTLVRDVAGQIQEEFTDCRFKEIVLSGEAGNRVTATCSFLGLTSEPATLSDTPTYETQSNMFMFYDGTFTKDGSSIGTIRSFEITIRAILDEEDQTTGIELADAPVIRFECECVMTLDVDETNKAEYDVVYYSGGSAATSFDDGTLNLTFNNGLSGENERELQIDLHKLIYTAQPVEQDPSSDETLRMEITAHCEKHSSNGLLTITTKSSRSS